MVNNYNSIKFLPCDPTDTIKTEEWLDALSMEGYLLKYESINSIYAKFEKADEAKRYYHLVIPTIKTTSMGFIHDEDYEHTSQTIRQCKENGMQYLGESAGCLFFRTADKEAAKKCVDLFGGSYAKKIFRNKVVTLLISLFAASVFTFHVMRYTGDLILQILCYTMIILIIFEETTEIIDIIRIKKEMQKDELLPTYQKEVKAASPILRCLVIFAAFMIVLLAVIILIYGNYLS